jgi:hypothetical protein
VHRCCFANFPSSIPQSYDRVKPSDRSAERKAFAVLPCPVRTGLQPEQSMLSRGLSLSKGSCEAAYRRTYRSCALSLPKGKRPDLIVDCAWLVRAGLRPAPTLLADGAGAGTWETSEVSTDLGGLVGGHPPLAASTGPSRGPSPSLRAVLRTGFPAGEGGWCLVESTLPHPFSSREGGRCRGTGGSLPPFGWGRIEEGVVARSAGLKSSATGWQTGPGAGSRAFRRRPQLRHTPYLLRLVWPG